MSDGLQVMRCSFRSGRFLLNTQMKSVCVTGLETESTLERRAPSGGHHRALQGWPRTKKKPFTCVVSSAGYPELHRHVPLIHVQLLSPARSRCGVRLLDAPPTLCHFVGSGATRLRNNSIPRRGVNYATALRCSRS